MTWSCQSFSLNLTAFPGGFSELSVGTRLPEQAQGSSHFFLVAFAHSYYHPSQIRMRKKPRQGEKISWAMRWGSILPWASKGGGASSSSLSGIPSTLLFSSCLTSDHHSLLRCALKLRKQGKERRKENLTPTLKE